MLRHYLADSYGIRSPLLTLSLFVTSGEIVSASLSLTGTFASVPRRPCYIMNVGLGYLA